MASKLKTLLNQASEKAGRAPERRAAADQPALELAQADVGNLVAMIGLNDLIKRLGERQTRFRDRARAALFRAFTAAFWAAKKKPPNPRIVIPVLETKLSHDTLYQLRDQFALGRFANRDDIVDALSAPAGEDLGALQDAPLARAQAVKLVHAEIESDPQLRLRYTLNELVEGHTEEDASGIVRFFPATVAEKTIAAKLLGFLLAESRTKRGPAGKVSILALTDAEREYLLIRDPRLHIKDAAAFMSRACGYVSNLAQFRRLLTTLRPTQVFSSSHFAQGASEAERARRLLELAGEVLDPGENPQCSMDP
jgi:hypothetical protein